jgi:hypothetical protein
MAELFAHGNQLLHELAKTTVFGDLRSGAIDRRSLGMIWVMVFPALA